MLIKIDDNLIKQTIEEKMQVAITECVGAICSRRDTRQKIQDEIQRVWDDQAKMIICDAIKNYDKIKEMVIAEMTAKIKKDLNKLLKKGDDIFKEG